MTVHGNFSPLAFAYDPRNLFGAVSYGVVREGRKFVNLFPQVKLRLDRAAKLPGRSA